MKATIKALPFLILISFSHDAIIAQRIDPDTVSAWFREIKENTRRYRELWNTDLYGPVLLVEQESKKVYSNYPDTAGILKPNGKIFSGILPANVNVANTAITWNGRSWAMIMLPLPRDRNERLDLLSHELFHRSQEALGFEMSNPSNDHLDKKEGRIYLRLELEALRQAIHAKSKEDIDRYLTDALYFRNHRYLVYPGAKSVENALELNEGLATYTGNFMSRRDSRQTEEYFENKIPAFKTNPTFVRSFAYLTVPLYGTLLSKSDKYWNRRTGSNTNLTDFFTESFGLHIPDNLGEEVVNTYGLQEIISEENKREEKIIKLKAGYIQTFIEKPHLEIRFEKMNISFDPRNIMPVEGYGTVYPGLRISDNWGVLNAVKGALLGSNWDKVNLSEPTLITSDIVEGDGWKIELNSGYIVEKDRPGSNYSLKKIGQP